MAKRKLETIAIIVSNKERRKESLWEEIDEKERVNISKKITDCLMQTAGYSQKDF